jgi:uncharacterized protein (DUF885 family)
MYLNRRDLIRSAGAAGAMTLLPACGTARAAIQTGDTAATALLDALAEEHLRLVPETATSLGVDVGPRGPLKARLTDASLAGRARTAQWLRSALARLDRLKGASLSEATRANLEIVRTTYRTSLDGFGFPYGDAAVSSWRNGPYVVAQNMGSY